MDEEQRNNDSGNEESEGSSSPETLRAVGASPSANARSVDASKEYAVSPTMETSQLAGLELGHDSESDVLDAEGVPTDDEFCAVTEAAKEVQTGNDPTGFSDLENTNPASVEHIHGESAPNQQEPLKSFIEAIREYDSLYDCYKSLKSILDRDINVFEELKRKVDEAERKDDEEGLKTLVRETKEKYGEALRYSPIRDAFVALHKELANLKKHIDGAYDHRSA